MEPDLKNTVYSWKNDKNTELNKGNIPDLFGQWYFMQWRSSHLLRKMYGSSFLRLDKRLDLYLRSPFRQRIWIYNSKIHCSTDFPEVSASMVTSLVNIDPNALRFFMWKKMFEFSQPRYSWMKGGTPRTGCHSFVGLREKTFRENVLSWELDLFFFSKTLKPEHQQVGNAWCSAVLDFSGLEWWILLSVPGSPVSSAQTPTPSAAQRPKPTPAPAATRALWPAPR